ncbi:flagellar hook assembly protein FlgD [Desulfuromonas thiophila]|uniref:flagellar hook assembly protein FlgD n=1 Tax=Desulfuromonas thiophila TaxID=57664 RepID=UPI0029F5C829|nr:flagellar hook assembly protein FlgD [Desulfuromonas thiophila]
MSSVTSANSSNSALTSALTSGKSALGKDDFLLLMVEQLKNQDPMNPADATEFTAQLAQFSSLEQLFNINDSLDNLSGSTAEMQRLSALSMIGSDIVTQASNFSYSDEPLQLGYKLESAADQGVLYVRDASGMTVASWPLTDLTAGEHFMTWDGRDDLGNQLPAGDYILGISAFSGEETVSARGLVQSRVLGIDMDSSGDLLVTASGTFKLADVSHVRQQSN